MYYTILVTSFGYLFFNVFVYLYDNICILYWVPWEDSPSDYMDSRNHQCIMFVCCEINLLLLLVWDIRLLNASVAKLQFLHIFIDTNIECTFTKQNIHLSLIKKMRIIDFKIQLLKNGQNQHILNVLTTLLLQFGEDVHSIHDSWSEGSGVACVCCCDANIYQWCLTGIWNTWWCAKCVRIRSLKRPIGVFPNVRGLSPESESLPFADICQ